MAQIINLDQCLEPIEHAKKILDERSSYYQQKYKVVPVLRAALHSGDILVGEIGKAPTKSFFSGETVNNTYRILSEAHQLNKPLLISEDCINKLPPVSDRHFEEVSVAEFKGASQSIRLMETALIS